MNGETRTVPRWGWPVALGAAAMWIAIGAAVAASPDPDSWDCNSSWDYALNAVDPVAFFLSAAAIWALRPAREGRIARVGRWAAAAGSLGAIAAGINNPIEHCAHVGILGLVLWVPAVMLLTGGLLGLGVTTLANQELPRWTGLALIGGAVGLLAGGEAGGLVHGLMWVVVAHALWLAGRRATG